MQVGDMIEYANGLRAQVQAVFDGLFVVQAYDHTGARSVDQWAACKGTADEWSFCFEGEEWRDSFTDALCDAEAHIMVHG